MCIFPQESTRSRQKYCESPECLNEVKSPPRKDGYMQFPNSFYEPQEDFTRPAMFNKSRRPPWCTRTFATGTEVTGLKRSTGFSSATARFSLSSKTKADVCFYGIIILFLLICILILYFLWRHQTKSFWSFLKFQFFTECYIFTSQGFLPDIFKVIGLKKRVRIHFN